MRLGLGVALVVLLLVACGGPPAAKTTAPIATSANSAAADDGPPPGPPKPSCDDGTCFVCGDSVCPHGFYCEVPKAGASPACAWSPRCKTASSCGCVPAPSTCRCEDKDGAAYVTCP